MMVGGIGGAGKQSKKEIKTTKKMPVKMSRVLSSFTKCM